jgi:PhzF family phenazine biosynthesis protein
MQRFAAEVNLSETAFIRRAGRDFQIRWFTPTVELGLVGHATLAAAHVIMRTLAADGDRLRFECREGVIEAWSEGDDIAIALPIDSPRPTKPPPELCAGLGLVPTETLKGRHYIAILPSQRDVQSLAPDLETLACLDLPTIAVTAPGDDVDYVLRFFAPANGVPEDPASGVAQCSLVPLWSERLGKHRLSSRQLSRRGASMTCHCNQHTVTIAGPSTLLFSGRLSPFLFANSSGP